MPWRAATAEVASILRRMVGRRGGFAWPVGARWVAQCLEAWAGARPGDWIGQARSVSGAAMGARAERLRRAGAGTWVRPAAPDTRMAARGRVRQMGKSTAMTDTSTPGSSAFGRRAHRSLFWALVACLAGVASGPANADTNPEVSEELQCLALTIYFEARGEPDEGKLAVGHVVMNRAQHPRFPGKICQVVQQGGEKLRYRCQFTWWCDGRSDTPRDWRAWERSKALARRVFWDYSRDPTGGALWYHSDAVAPSWRAALNPGPKIGRHIFYRSSDDTRTANAGFSLPTSYEPR